MIKLLLVFLLPITIYASKILSYNIYDRTDRADIMITFDVPYDGIIKKSVVNSTSKNIVIKLEDASIESSKLKQISSKYIKRLAITPLKGHVQLIATVSDDVDLKVSKTSDAYGLRLRFQEIAQVASKTKVSTQTGSSNQQINLSSLPTKKTDDMAQSYYIVITILIIGIIILFIIKRKITPKNSAIQNQTKNASKTKETKKPVDKPKQQQGTEVSIRFQQGIDENNSVVMLDFLDQSYLVMMGTTNVLLDRFNDDKPTSQEEFNVVLQEHQQMLESFLSSHNTQDDSGVKSYSQKASTISYNA